ncbi:ZIP family metal transporter [Enterovirga sp.]|uniref:ZIP family metal transporter n=1 Tax=Enterovirga sp. TaxID=2026350 RepID=UPI00261BC796|nr:ZIP family metal transporter [Enterovirga sp.]MDB5592216.1 putative divalent heavy-metal cations transporter [Enterovirga sp.]
MAGEIWIVGGVAAAGALASPIGGVLALWRQPTSLFMSLALGFAAGVLLATIGLEMMPKALELGSVPIAAGGFAAGMGAVYGLDLWTHRGRMAGPKADQCGDVRRFHSGHPSRASDAAVLAGGTSAEELIEGLSIGIGAAIDSRIGIMIALAIVIDNVAEALSIGTLMRSEESDATKHRRRILGWTGLIGLSLLVSTLAGWFLLRDMPKPALGFLFAAGAGGMFYLTVSQLVPDAEERHYQQSAALAAAAGFVLIFVLSNLVGGE